MPTNAQTCPRCARALPTKANGRCPTCAETKTPPQTAANPNRWYWSRNQKKQGPVSTAQLQTMARTGQLLPTDLVMLESQGRWLKADTVPKLFTAAAAPAKARKRSKLPWVLAGLAMTGMAAAVAVAAGLAAYTGQFDGLTLAQFLPASAPATTEATAQPAPAPTKTAPPAAEEKPVVIETPAEPKDPPAEPKTPPPPVVPPKVEKPEPTPTVPPEPPPPPKPVETKPAPEEKPAPPPEKPAPAPEKPAPPPEKPAQPAAKPMIRIMVVDGKPTPGVVMPDGKFIPLPPKPMVRLVDVDGKPTPSIVLADGTTVPLPGAGDSPSVVMTPEPKPEMKPEMKPEPPDSTATVPPETGLEKPGAPNPKAQAAVKSSIAWLLKNQKADGSWQPDMGDNRPALVATTSFAAMSLLASGGSHDVQVRKAAAYVLDNIFENRMTAKLPPEWDQSNWKIAIGGLFLAEYYARLKARDPKYKSPQLETALQRCVDEAMKRMEATGGWGHTPTLKNPLGYVELEIVSNWMLPMLGACQRLGMKVPQEKVDLSLKYVQDCCREGQGSVGYSNRPGQRGMGDSSRTGGAIFGFAALGKQKTPFYNLMVRSYLQQIDDAGEGHGSLAMGYIGAALGARSISEAAWKSFDAKHYPTILKAANADGSFKFIKGTTIKATGFDDKLGPAYNTAVYSLLLQLDSGNLKFMGQRLAPAAPVGAQ